jgi:hypothetical protein
VIRFHPLVRRRAIPGAFLFIVTRSLTYLLALCVFFAPLAPAFAVVTGDNEAHGAHASHEADHVVSGSLSDHHPSKPCTAHDSCDGQCCAGCAHCLGVISLFQPVHFDSHPDKTPLQSRLDSLDLIALPDRPPRSFSL